MATTQATRPAEPTGPANPIEAVRERLMPRTVLGLTVLILAFSIGAAFSGVVFYSYYEFRKDSSDSLAKNFEDEFDDAVGTIRAERDNGKAEIQKELEPLRKIRAEGETLQALLKQTSPSVWFVRTLDEAGQPSVGSAFVVASDDDQTLMLTSYTTVRAATRRPGPQVVVRKGDQEVRADLQTWQEDKDLALLVINRGNVPKLDFAPRDPAPRAGERIFAVSGLGAAGAAISQGFVADASDTAIQHDASLGTAFQGGPLVDSNGKVVAVASRSFAPLGFQTSDVYFGVPIRGACDRVLKCPDGTVSGAGSRR